MPTEDLKDAIKAMMVEKLMLKIPKEEIGDDTPLFGPEGLGLDSIDALELVVSLESFVLFCGQFDLAVADLDKPRVACGTKERFCKMSH